MKTTETWYFKDAAEIVSTGCNISEDISFTSNGHFYNSIQIDGSPGMTGISYHCTPEDFSGVNVWETKRDEKIWSDENFRIIVLEEPATGELLEFLQANATKQ